MDKKPAIKTAGKLLALYCAAPLLLLSFSACARTDKVTIYATARAGGWLWAREETGAAGKAG